MSQLLQLYHLPSCTFCVQGTNTNKSFGEAKNVCVNLACLQLGFTQLSEFSLTHSVVIAVVITMKKS